MKLIYENIESRHETVPKVYSSPVEFLWSIKVFCRYQGHDDMLKEQYHQRIE